MTIDIQILLINDVQSSDADFVLDCKRYLNLSAVEVRHKGNDSRDRSPLWRVVQGKTDDVIPGVAHYFLGVEGLNDKSRVRQWKMNRDFWTFVTKGKFSDKQVLRTRKYVLERNEEKYIYARAELPHTLSF
jgi:hypothetical protein